MDQRAALRWSTRAPELRAHGGPGVSDAGGWTLLPGKDGRQKFFIVCEINVLSLLYCPGHCAG